jgi:hypothetical protein
MKIKMRVDFEWIRRPNIVCFLENDSRVFRSDFLGNSVSVIVLRDYDGLKQAIKHVKGVLSVTDLL